MAREAAKVAREKERAEKAAERAREKEARDAAKALQSAQKGKRMASQPSIQSNKRQKRVVDAVLLKSLRCRISSSNQNYAARPQR